MRRVVVGHPVQERHGVEDARRVARRDVDSSGQLGADGQEDGVESALAALALDVVHGVVELDVDAEGDDAVDLGVEDRSGEPIGGDAVAHHAPELRCRVDQVDLVTEPAQVVGGAQPGRAGADHEDALARCRGRPVAAPSPARWRGRRGSARRS